jgi:hypothetical protein
MEQALGVVVALAAVLAAALVAAAVGARAAREKYGPPPGWYRALSPDELDSRGWPEYPLEYTGNTASSVSHLILRSA